MANVPGKQNISDDVNKYARTAVIGGFPADTERVEVKEFLSKPVLQGLAGIDKVYAYSFGNVGLVRFHTEKCMWDFIKIMNSKAKPAYKSKELWVSTSKTPEDRRKAKTLGKYKKVLIEVGLAQPTDVRIDYKRGLLFLKKIRIGDWTSEKRLDMKPEKLAEAGAMVDVKMLENAVDELMGKE